MVDDVALSQQQDVIKQVKHLWRGLQQRHEHSTLRAAELTSAAGRAGCGTLHAPFMHVADMSNVDNRRPPKHLAVMHEVAGRLDDLEGGGAIQPCGDLVL